MGQDRATGTGWDRATGTGRDRATWTGQGYQMGQDRVTGLGRTILKYFLNPGKAGYPVLVSYYKQCITVENLYCCRTTFEILELLCDERIVRAFLVQVYKNKGICENSHKNPLFSCSTGSLGLFSSFLLKHNLVT